MKPLSESGQKLFVEILFQEAKNSWKSVKTLENKMNILRYILGIRALFNPAIYGTWEKEGYETDLYYSGYYGRDYGDKDTTIARRKEGNTSVDVSRQEFETMTMPIRSNALRMCIPFLDQEIIAAGEKEFPQFQEVWDEAKKA